MCHVILTVCSAVLLAGMVRDVPVKWLRKQTMAFVLSVLPLSPVLEVCGFISDDMLILMSYIVFLKEGLVS